jgi:hypothetical protein
MNENAIPPISPTTPVTLARNPLDFPGRPGADYEGRLFRKSDSLQKKQLAVEKGIIQIMEKIRVAKPEETHVLKAELKLLERLRYTFLGEQSYSERSTVGKICSVWKTYISGYKNFTIPKNEVKNFQQQIAKVYGSEIWNFGEGSSMRLVRAGKDMSYAELMELTKKNIEKGKRLSLPTAEAEELMEYLNKTQPLVEQHIPKIQFAAKKIKTAFSSKKPAKNDKRMDVVFTNKAICAIKEVGRYLWRSDERVTFKEDKVQALSQKTKILVRHTFGDEVKVEKTRRSVAGKTNVQFIKDGKELSKANLVEITVAKMQDIQKLIEEARQKKADQKEIQGLQKRLVVAEQLVTMLLDRNVIDYLSMKREALFGLIKGIALFSNAIDSLAAAPMKMYDKWYINRGIRKIIAPYTLFRTEESIKNLKKQIQGTIDLCSKKDDSFEKAVKTIMEDKRTGKQLTTELFAFDNVALKRSLKEGNARAAHFIIEQGLFKDVTKEVLHELYNMPHVPPEGTELLVRDLFAKCNDHASCRRIIDFLVFTGESNLAQELIAEVLEREKGNLTAGPNGTPKLSEKHIVCLQQAAKYGSDKLLEKAFGVTEKSTLEEIIKAVKPFVLLPDSNGDSLLGYACGGHNAQFVTGVNLAIKERYLEPVDKKLADEKIEAVKQEIKECQEHNIPEAYIEALKGKLKNLMGPGAHFDYRKLKKNELQELLKVCNAKKKTKDQKNAEVSNYINNNIINKFPELSYFKKKFEEYPNEISKHIQREIENLDVDPFLARNVKLVRPLRSMTLSLAADMDNLMEEKSMLINGKKPHVVCFTSAVNYYNILYSRKSPLAVVSSIADEFYSWSKYFVDVLAMPGLVIPIGIDVALKIQAVFVGVYTSFQGVVYGAWYDKHIPEDLSRTQLGAYNRNLYQFCTAYPLNTMTPAGPLQVPAAMFDAGMRANIYQKAEEINPRKINSYKEQLIVGKMVGQKTEGVIRLLEDLKNNKEGKIDGGRLVTGYLKLSRYPKDSREKVFELLFGLLSNANQISSVINIQLESGRKGQECIEKFIEKQADIWKKGEIPKPHQYEAAIFATARLGNVELLQKLLDIKLASAEFTAGGRWKLAGGKNTSLLHAAISSKIPGSSRKKALMVEKIYQEIVKDNRLDLDVELLNKSGEYDPLAISRKGQMPIDLIGGNEASSLDKTFHLNPQLPGSFTYALTTRTLEKNRGLAGQAILTVAPYQIIGKLGRPIADIVGFFAAIAVSKFGPIAMFVTDIGVRMLIIKFFSIIGASTGACLGQGFSRSLNQIENDVYLKSSLLTQMGTTQKGFEDHLIKNAEENAKIIKLLDKETDAIAYKHVLEGMDNAIAVADNSGDSLSKNDLEKIREEIRKLPKDVRSKELFKTLHQSLSRSDVAMTLRLIISQPLGVAIMDPEVYLRLGLPHV